MSNGMIFIKCNAAQPGSGAPGQRLRNETRAQPGVACTQMLGHISRRLLKKIDTFASGAYITNATRFYEHNKCSRRSENARTRISECRIFACLIQVRGEKAARDVGDGAFS